MAYDFENIEKFVRAIERVREREREKERKEVTEGGEEGKRIRFYVLIEFIFRNFK